jgi:ABC-2 type transport system ATP-binding protein
MPEALALRGVSKSFAEVKAVQKLDLTVEPGSVYGLLGPNGAGKSTAIRMIMDIIKPDTGEIVMLGERDPDRRRDWTGYLPEERGLYRKMKVLELVVYFARLHGMETGKARNSARRWLERMELGGWAQSKLEALSKGMQQKVQFIATIVHHPKVLILDEPFSGLDPVNVDLVKSILLEQRDQGATLLLSTHQMDMVEKLCDTICLINRGQVMLQGPLNQIKAERGTRAIQLEYEGKPSFHKDPALVARADDSGRYMELFAAPGVDHQAILQAAAREVRIHRFQLMEPSLNQIFIDTVRAQGGE